MAYITPAEALARLSDGKRKTKGRAQVTEFVRGVWPHGDNDCAVYVFRRGKGGLIAPADDALPPLLGECESGDLTVELPEPLEEWLQGYADEVDNARLGRCLIEDEEPGMVYDTAKADIPAMIKATWAQTAPYNANLVFGDAYEGKACKVGCVAVAIGQILYYWGQKGYRRGCTATTGYRYTNNPAIVCALPPITVFDYKNLTAGKPGTKAQKAAVATLLEYCGKASKLDYSPTGTGGVIATYSAAMRLRLRLGSAITTISAATMGDAAFERRVYQELAAGRPVVMQGYKPTCGGHAFVVDGYIGGLYHINWGWGGTYNGRYALSALDPAAGYSYNTGKMAVVGIQPDYRLGDVNGDGDVNVTDVMVVARQMNEGGATDAADINSDSKVDGQDQQAIVNHILGKGSL